MDDSIRAARIAIAGHINVGKTTLLRTITRKQVGEIADRAGVTTQTHHELHTTLQAIFIDCPGFERAGLIRFLYLMHDQRLPSLEEFQRFELIASSQKKAAEAEKDKENKEEKKGYRATAKAELDAVAALQQADAAIYVASVEYVPDTGYDHEIALVVTMQPNTVAVINKARVAESSQLGVNVTDRIAQWTETFAAAGVKHIVVLDAHWHTPARMTELYDALLDSLEGEAREGFRIGVDRFAQWRGQIRSDAAKVIARSVSSLRLETDYSKFFDPDGAKAESASRYMRNACKAVTTNFLTDIGGIYRVACHSEAKIAPSEAAGYDEEEAVLAAGIGLAFPFLALLARALVTFRPTLRDMGGLSGWLLSWAGGGRQNRIRLYFDSRSLEQYAAWALRVVCAQSRHGYGLGAKLETAKLDDTAEEVKAAMMALAPGPAWESDPESNIAEYCGRVLASLDGISSVRLAEWTADGSRSSGDEISRQQHEVEAKKTPMRAARIAIAGHIGVGKTTLLHTITQTHHEYEVYRTLQAIFCDCDGFVGAGRVLCFYRMHTRLPSLEELQQFGRNASRTRRPTATVDPELETALTLHQADAAIYVASIEDNPDGEIEDEINLVVTMQPNTVAVINKVPKAQSLSSGGCVKERLANWEWLFSQAGIKHVLILDAHGHMPARMTELNDALLDILKSRSGIS